MRLERPARPPPVQLRTRFQSTIESRRRDAPNRRRYRRTGRVSQRQVCSLGRCCNTRFRVPQALPSLVERLLCFSQDRVEARQGCSILRPTPRRARQQRDPGWCGDRWEHASELLMRQLQVQPSLSGRKRANDDSLARLDDRPCWNTLASALIFDVPLGAVRNGESATSS